MEHQRARVMVIGQASDDRSDEAFLSLPGAIVIGKAVAPDQLIKALEKVVSSEEGSNG